MRSEENCLYVKNLSFYILRNLRLERLLFDQIDFHIKQNAQCVLQPNKTKESDTRILVKFNQHIEVTFLRRVALDVRTKHAERFDVIPRRELGGWARSVRSTRANVGRRVAPDRVGLARAFVERTADFAVPARL